LDRILRDGKDFRAYYTVIETGKMVSGGLVYELLNQLTFILVLNLIANGRNAGRGMILCMEIADGLSKRLVKARSLCHKLCGRFKMKRICC